MTAVTFVLFFLQLVSYGARSAAFEFTTTYTQTNHFLYVTDDPDYPVPTSTPFPSDFDGPVQRLVIPPSTPSNYPTPVSIQKWSPTPYWVYVNHYFHPADFSEVPYTLNTGWTSPPADRKTVIIEPFIYYGPTTCRHQWTYTTWQSVSVYDEATPIVLAHATATSTSVLPHTKFGEQTATTTGVFATLPTVTDQALASNAVDYRVRGSGCWMPGTDPRDESPLNIGSEAEMSSEVTEWWKATQEQVYRDAESSYRRRTTIWATVLGIMAFIPLCGLVESYIWFARLMCGERTLRGLTICWGLCLAVVGLLLISIVPAKQSKEEREELRNRWRGYTTRERLRLWRQWGMRKTYPVGLLGEDPRTKVAEEEARAGDSMELPVYTPGDGPPPADTPRMEPPPYQPPAYQPPAGN